ncbi:MAG: hypothetical protein AAGA75_28240 [Cyanobacteria bacterium P01_E01_bin.6]
MTVQTIANIRIDQIPDRIFWNKKSQALNVRQYHLKDLKSLIQQANTEHEWKHLVIYADKIDFDFERDQNFSIDLSGRNCIVIVCRKWNFKSDGKLTFWDSDADPNTLVRLRVQEVLKNGQPLEAAGPLALLTGESFYSLRLDGGGLDCQVAMSDPPRQSSFLQRRTVPNDWNIGSDFYWMLVESFQQSFKELATDADEARSRLNWVKKNTFGISWRQDSLSEMSAMGYQAASQLLQLDRPKTPYYVPKLGLSRQRRLIMTDVEAALGIETAFNNYISQETDLKTRQGLAQQIQNSVESKISEIDQKIQDLNNNQLAAAQAAMKENIKVFNRQRAGLRNNNKEPHVAAPGPLESARTAFQEAIEEKKAEAEAQAWLAGFEGVASLGVAVTGGISAVTTISSSAGAIANLVKQLETVVKILQSVNAMIKIGENIEKLVSDVGSKSNTDSVGQLPDAAEAASMSDTDWKTLKERWDSALDPYISDSTLGPAAAKYRAEGRILLIYGQAAMDNRITIANLQGQIVELLMNRKLYQAHEQRIKNFVDATNAETEQVHEIALLLRQRYLDTKRDLILDIENYNNAFRYWALEDSPSVGVNFLTTLNDIAGMAKVSGQMEQAEDRRLRGFTSPSKAAICHIYHPLTNAQRKALSNGDPIDLPIDFFLQVDPSQKPVKSIDESRLFTGYDRIRVTSVEVYFEGLPENDAEKGYHATIKDNGFYLNRWKTKEFAFVAEATLKSPSSHKVGEYQGLEADKKGNTNSITTSDEQLKQSDLAAASSDPYFLSSIFTTWSVTLPQNEAQNGDISWNTPDLALILNFQVYLMQG